VPVSVASVCKFTDAEKAKLKELLAGHKAAMDAWNKDKGAKVAELKKAAAEAKKAKDRDKAKAIAAEMKPLTAEQRKLRDAQKAEILGILTDQQKADWEIFEVRRRAMQRFGRVKPKLTDEQKEKAKPICEAAAKDIIKLEGKEQRQAYDALTKKIADQVLTDEQRESMKAKRVKRPKEPGAKKPGGRKKKDR